MAHHHTALIIIDMQAGAFDGRRITPVSESDRLLANISRLIGKAKQASVPIVFIQHQGEQGHPFEVETDGFRLHPDLDVTDEVIIPKSTPDAFYHTDLHNTLASIGVTNLVIAGIQTEYCIDTTCRKAFSLDYKVTLVEDAHGTWDTDLLTSTQIINHHNELLGNWFATLKGVDDIAFES